MRTLSIYASHKEIDMIQNLKENHRVCRAWILTRFTKMTIRKKCQWQYDSDKLFKDLLTNKIFLRKFYLKTLRWSKGVNFPIFYYWLKSFIYNEIRRGARTDPWGTPQFIAARPSSYPFIYTYQLPLYR